mmetsp:Transcript_29588/g.62754  ORF Transcript_29588/g.62754 Transcript_29588/m.62754 type:complete len:119 (-) Transcript_29588:412-768(-)
MTTFLLLVVTILIHATISNATPAPSSYPADGDGGIEVGDAYIGRTMSPTINVMALTGRGVPSKLPTLKPTMNPTLEEMGNNVNVNLPGIDYSPGAVNNAGDGDEEVDTYVPTSSPTIW